MFQNRLKLLLQLIFILSSFFVLASAFYDSTDNVVELTDSNFKTRVQNDDAIWIVEFYAPWCGHCKNLVPEYKKLAKLVKGIYKVGAVDMTAHESVGRPYGISGFPTIKIFGRDKNKPTDFNGARTADTMITALLEETRQMITSRGGKTGGSSGGSGGGGGSGKTGSKGGDVVELTDENFEKEVLQSKEPWLVEFYAPWCGHCKNLEPHWKSAASQLKGQFKLGAVDATKYTSYSSRFQVKGFPTIKYFPAGDKSVEDAQDYNGGRTSGDIVSWAKERSVENLPAPELQQITSAKIVKKECSERQLCVITFLPVLLDCQSKCRNKQLDMLKKVAEKLKKHQWGWLWAEAAQQPELEEALGIGGFGYPAMVAVNARKLKYSTLTGSFGSDGIYEFLRDLSYGKGRTSSLKGTEFPNVVSIPVWDGKDGELPKEEELDISDVDLNEEL